MRPKLEDDPKRAAFDVQATSGVLDKVHRAARARMHVYAGRTQHVNAGDVEDVVQTIIIDTLNGTLSWDHEKKPLLQHLLDSVRFRVRNDARRRWRDKTRYEVLDEDATDASVGDSMIAGEAPAQPDDELATRRITDQLVAELRLRIAGDCDVERLFDAIVTESVLDRAEIMAVTGMSATTYKNARRRLNRILLQLPPEIRDAVMSAFTN